MVKDIRTMNVNEIKQIVTSIEQNIPNNGDEVEYIIGLLRNDSRKLVQKLGDKLDLSFKKHLEELKRIKRMYDFDSSFGNYKYVAGVDEVGRGPLAGPIVAAAVILKLDYADDKDLILYINDSKKISARKRQLLSERIKAKAVSFSIAQIENNIIDEKGIAWCNNQVFIEAVKGLNVKPEFVLSDGYEIKNFNINNVAVVKGDLKSASIACASIIAKVYRDNIMKKYAQMYPQYDFQNNVGYGTKAHIDGINKYGRCDIHRRSFIKNFEKS